MAGKRKKQTKQTRKVISIGDTSRAFASASGEFIRDGQPVKRFLKDMISAGVYTHPVHGWDLDVTVERMDNWIAAFSRMQENGVDVEVPVDHSMQAEDNRGYVVEMFRGGNPAIMSIYPNADDPQKLYGVHELVGEGSIELAARNKNVSVLIEKDFKDGAGVAYGEAIVHSSIVQQPVIPDQNGFVPIAASREGTKKNNMNPSIPLYVLSLESKKLQENTMKDETLVAIRKVLGAGEDLTAENALSRIEERFAKDTEDKAVLSKKVTDLEGSIETLKASQSEEKAASKMDQDTLDMLSEGVEGKIEGLVACGKLTPDAGKHAKDVLIGEAGKQNVMMLSRTASKTDASLAKKFLSIIEKNGTIADFNEATNSQSFSRNVPGEEDGFDKETMDEMIESAC